jgi:RNA polymerase sigma-70 factor (ECF subfamily)
MLDARSKASDGLAPAVEPQTCDAVGAAMPDPDRDLVERAIAGDRTAFGELLGRHYDRLHRIAWRLTGSVHDAEDIAQEVCCALVERIAGFRGEAKFSTWITGILINACRDQHRRKAAARRLQDELAVVATLAPRPDGRDLYCATWLQSEIARLEPHLREAVVLVVGEDMSHAEAARALGVAESTVSWRMHEVRRRLRAGPLEETFHDG